MDAHQAYCLNFLALTRHWGSGSAAAAVAWGLSVLALTFTVTAAWLLGELMAKGPGIVDRSELSTFEFWVAVVVTPLNYLRFFRFMFDGADASAARVSAPSLQSERPAIAVVSLVGPAALILVLVLYGAE